MSLLESFLYTGYRARFSYPFLLLNRILSKNYIKVENNFENLIKIVQSYENIVVVGAGPSAANIKHSKENIYVTTNSSYLALPNNSDFIHVLNDISYLYKFLAFGLNKDPLITYIYAPYSNRNNFGYHVMDLIKKYPLGKSYKSKVEVVSQDRNLTSNEYRNIFNEIEKINNGFEMENPGGNSGLMILNFGLLLSVYLKKRLRVYGLDAGEGGKIYFDGRKISEKHIAMRPEHKKIMGDYLEYLSKDYPLFENYSFFKGNAFLDKDPSVLLAQ